LHTNFLSRNLARTAERRLRRCACDLVFAPAGAILLAHLRTNLPVVYLSDATLRLMVNYYLEFSGMLPSQVQIADQLEQKAVKRANRLIYPSTWAARSAIEHYHARPERVHIVPFGANLENPPARETALRVPSRDTCELLFVGGNWGRKGGEIAFETLLELRNLGVAAELTIVGCQPPDCISHDHLRVIPFLDKNDSLQREQLNNLFVKAHFFLLPTRAECFSIALCEANAFGLPCISTQTGGIQELVRSGVNGYLLPVQARGDRYAALIRDVFADGKGYEAIRRSSRAEFESRLNWDTWGRQVSQVFESVASGNPAGLIIGA
jgi:glycosyltransferase involved in cell wall biosynthesis